MRVPAWVLALVIVVLLLIGGAAVGRHLFPRVVTVQVDREVLKVIEKLVPGETRTIIKEVPGPERWVEVPVVIEKIVPIQGPERVVTITKPVEVPIEVVRERWPQTITVRVGSLLTDKDEWVVPKFQDLLIGQVSPGVYAVPVQVGWKVEQVRTETQLPKVSVADRWHVEFRPAVGVLSVGGTTTLAAGVQVQATKQHLSLEVGGGLSTSGPWGLAFLSYRF